MSRNQKKDAEVRESRKKQILDAALTVYIRYGYHGTDMDAVAEEAGLAKGLLYYYFKTKNELFSALYIWMLDDAFALSAALLEETKALGPVMQLMRYTYGMFLANKDNSRLMQFSMRMPFDAYAIFGPDGWKDGAEKSDSHHRALTSIIAAGTAQGCIPDANPESAASSFWSVFVANCFAYSKLIMGNQPPAENEAAVFQDIVQFCFQGLGIPFDVWNACLRETIESQKEESGA